VSRPNIVVFVPDQLRADALGCFGNPVASTPNIDALAARGTRFSQAFGQHPFCTQSRVSFLTGLYPHVHGHRTLNQTIKPWHPDALGLVKAAGYHVAHAGMRGDTFSPGHTQESTSRFGWTVLPSMIHTPSPYGPDHKLGRAFYHGLRPGSVPALDFDEACIQTAETWLAEGLPEPWLLYVPLFFPHPPFEAEEPWFSLHARADVPLPSPGPVGDDGPLFKRLVHERYGLARLDEDDWREIVATYYGMVSRIDAHLGRLLAAVDATGSLDRTAVLFFPDHGEYLGDFGLIEKWVSGVDPCLVHNPLIVAVPDGPSGVVVDGLVELVDVAPTLCELADVDPPPRQFGRSLLSGSGREAAFSEGGLAVGDAEPEPVPFPYDLKHALEAEVPVTAGKVAAIRTSEWTYVHRVLEAPELYDRVADPAETTNLASDQAHAPVLASLREQLLTWMVDTADIRGPVDPRFDPKGALMP